MIQEEVIVKKRQGEVLREKNREQDREKERQKKVVSIRENEQGNEDDNSNYNFVLLTHFYFLNIFNVTYIYVFRSSKRIRDDD